jgi:hypothetical protein
LQSQIFGVKQKKGAMRSVDQLQSGEQLDIKVTGKAGVALIDPAQEDR